MGVRLSNPALKQAPALLREFLGSSLLPNFTSFIPPHSSASSLDSLPLALPCPYKYDHTPFLLKTLSWLPIAPRWPATWHDLVLLSSPTSSFCLPASHATLSHMTLLPPSYPLHMLFFPHETLCLTLTHPSGLSFSSASSRKPLFSEFLWIPSCSSLAHSICAVTAWRCICCCLS